MSAGSKSEPKGHVQQSQQNYVTLDSVRAASRKTGATIDTLTERLSRQAGAATEKSGNHD
jgi:hypothetical protein